MSENDESPPAPAAEPPPAPAPRRWEPPSIRSGQLFEANSLACGKSNPTEGEQCMMDSQS
jgi:hypothetical protein